MKKNAFLLLLVLFAIILSACGAATQVNEPKPSPLPAFTNLQGTPTTKCAEPGCENFIAPSGNTAYCIEHSSTCFFCEKYIDKDASFICDDCIKEIEAEAEKQPSTDISFTNAYGTPTTKCAHTGCNNYIASSGDTNCCILHSKQCHNCGKYIDEDASYCLDCIEKALGSSSSGSPSSNSAKTATCNYCKGTGKADGGTCPWCNGTGKTYDNSFNDLLG